MTSSESFELNTLLLNLDVQHVQGRKGASIMSLATDSRRVQPGALFIAYKGVNRDGHDHISSAITSGANSLLVEDLDQVPKNFEGPVYKSHHIRLQIPILAQRFFQNPTNNMLTIGVTGTNGKTTTTYLLESILKANGYRVGTMGTIDHHFENTVWKSDLTTPGPIELHSRLSEMRNLGATAIVMEVSSHALHQCRADCVQFDGAIFTNLSRDHLDYHPDINHYFESKSLLFTKLLNASGKKTKVAVIQSDGEWGRKLSALISTPMETFGRTHGEVRIKKSWNQMSGLEFQFERKGTLYDVKTELVGEFNVENCLGALLCCVGMGCDLEKSIQSLKAFKGVPGRLENVGIKYQRNVFVDYAHTPDALSGVLKTIVNSIKLDANFKTGKVISVFGCGGDRDKGKRPEMFAAADSQSDVCILTSDNPRSEAPGQIIDDMLMGRSKRDWSSEVHIEPDRRRAIELGISMLGENDILLIAGKGHEDYQIIGEKKNKFSDKLVAEEILKGR